MSNHAEVYTCPPDFGFRVVVRRNANRTKIMGFSVVASLCDLATVVGQRFVAGTVFEVLRHDGDKLNLCEVDLTHPYRVGRTICNVSVGDVKLLD